MYEDIIVKWRRRLICSLERRGRSDVNKGVLLKIQEKAVLIRETRHLRVNTICPRVQLPAQDLATLHGFLQRLPCAGFDSNASANEIGLEASIPHS